MNVVSGDGGRAAKKEQWGPEPKPIQELEL